VRHLTQRNLPPGPSRGVGEREGKPLRQGIPCQCEASSVHADFSDALHDTNYIWSSASFLSAQDDLRTG
jgi:hypothetical protein